MVHILHELDAVLFTTTYKHSVLKPSLFFLFFSVMSCPQLWDYRCEGLLKNWKYVLETTSTQIPHEYSHKS